MTQLGCGGEAQALPSPALRNVFTRTWAAGAFQDGQPILLSLNLLARLSPAGEGSRPHPGLAGSRQGAGPGASGQPSAPAPLCPCPRGKGCTTPGSGTGSQGSRNLPGAPKHVPNPRGGGGTSELLYPHDVIPGRETEIPLLSSRRLLTGVPTTRPRSASCQATCHGWAGHGQ